MSLFGRAAGAFGGAVANVANKYLDEQLIQQRAQMMADLQRTTAGNIRQDDDAFRNDPTRVARDRQKQADDMVAQGAAARTVKREELQDTGLTDAAIARDGLMSKAKASQARDETKTAAGDTEFLAAQGKLKLADPEVAARIAASKASAASAYASAGVNSAQAEGIRLTNADKKKLDALYTEASSILSDPKLDDDGRGKAFGKVQQQITLIKSKNGQSPGRDPELDRETITEEFTDPKTGKVTKTQRTEIRRPTPGGSAADPYAVPQRGKPASGDPYSAAPPPAGPKPQQRVSAQPPTQAAPADPMAAQMAQESSEMNRGTRMDFSDEVKQYIQQGKQSREQASLMASAAIKEKERLRAIAESKAQLGR